MCMRNCGSCGIVDPYMELMLILVDIIQVFQAVALAASKFKIHRAHILCDWAGDGRSLLKKLPIPARVSSKLSQIRDIGNEILVVCPSSFDSDTLLTVLEENLQFSRSLPWLILEDSSGNSTNNLILENFKPGINHRVYFLRTDNLTFVEKYTINDIAVERLVARVSSDEGGSGRPPVLVKEVDTFLKRRALDFKGARLKAVVDFQQPYLMLKPDPEDEAQYREKWKDGDPLRQLDESRVFGIFRDILSDLEGKMNFSTDFSTRGDDLWGYPGPNGTWVGMVANVLVCNPTTIQLALRTNCFFL